jgi:L-asparagine transporter-like permease
MLASIATLIACLPIFFGGLIFSLCFRESNTPALYLSANLLGVAVGGLTENLCMVTGIKNLVIIAMILYALSFLALRVGARQCQTPESSSST